MNLWIHHVTDCYTSAPSGRCPPVTTTGYRGWGTSSSRPSRRRTWRTSDTPTASASHGWVSDGSPAPSERHWARHIHKRIRALKTIPPPPTTHRWTLRRCVSKAAVWLMDFLHSANFSHVALDQKTASYSELPARDSTEWSALLRQKHKSII